MRLRWGLFCSWGSSPGCWGCQSACLRNRAKGSRAERSKLRQSKWWWPRSLFYWPFCGWCLRPHFTTEAVRPEGWSKWKWESMALFFWALLALQGFANRWTIYTALRSCIAYEFAWPFIRLWKLLIVCWNHYLFFVSLALAIIAASVTISSFFPDAFSAHQKSVGPAFRNTIYSSSKSSYKTFWSNKV